MALLATLNGGPVDDGFLIAPGDGRSYPATLELGTDDQSTPEVTLEVSGDAELSAESITVECDGTEVTITATDASSSRGDVGLTIKTDKGEQLEFRLTAIADPRVHFAGRFQARFATDGDFYNDPRGGNRGWTWALEGEPDFVPPTDNVPLKTGMAVGRVVRYSDPEALRMFADPIGVQVDAVEAEVGGSTESFTHGDPVIGDAVKLGPASYFASNRPANPADPPPFESYPAGLEVMDNAELHIGSRFSGKPRDLADRPRSSGFFGFSQAELNDLGIVPLSQWNQERRDQLLEKYRALPSAEKTGTVEGRNLATRISHLGGSPSDGIAPSAGTLTFGWTGYEEYSGRLNDEISTDDAGSPVMSYLGGFPRFLMVARFFNYHSDELCGRSYGTLQADVAALARDSDPQG